MAEKEAKDRNQINIYIPVNDVILASIIFKINTINAHKEYQQGIPPQASSGCHTS